MLTASYGDFTRLLARKNAGLRAPMKATFEVTRRCPLACAHCYNNLPTGDRPARDAELSLDEHRRLLDELADTGCLWLLYTGGEIFARPDFMDIYRHARSRGFLITLFTNGTQITPAIADELGEQRPFRMEITLYGHTRETYERVTGVPGSFERCRRGIDLLLARRVPLALKTVALTLNQHEIPEMKRFAEERALPFKFDALMNPRLDGAVDPLAVRLSAEATVRLDLADPGRAADLGTLARKLLAAPPEAPRDKVYQCGGGVSAFAVDPYGRMSICVLSERERFDLRKGTLSEGWGHFLRKVRDRPISRVTKCTACGLRALCGMCPAAAQLENGDPEEPVDFLCQVAHLRALALAGPDDEAGTGRLIPAHGDCEYCAGGEHHQHLVESAMRLRASSPGSWPPATGAPERVRRSLALLPAASALAGDGCGSGCEVLDG